MPEEIFFALTDNSPHPTFAADLDSGQCVYANPAFDRLTGRPAGGLFIDSFLSLIHPEDIDYLKKSYQDFRTDTYSQDIDFRMKNTSDNESWIRLTPFHLKQDGKSYIVGILSDITAEVRNVNSLKKYANKKNSVLQILAHDLLGPLGIARTITQIMEKEARDTELISKIGTISNITNQAISLIRDLTDREFLETVEAELVKKRIDIVLKLKEYLEECKKSESSTRRHFVFNSSAPSIFISLDESKFFQVINNLLTNSLKFTKDWDTISLSVEERDDIVSITFADTGIGIPAHLQPKVFDKFTEARRTGLHGEPTVGLGLSIARTIIEWHHGTIGLESTENEGTTFYIEIPKLN
jgi:two-component system, OmpR family, sensor histidine kinase VicK